MQTKLTFTLLTGIFTAACGAGDLSEEVGNHDATPAEPVVAAVEGAHYVTERISIQPDEMAAFEVTEPWVDVLVLVDAEGERLTPSLVEEEVPEGAIVTRALTERFFDGLSIPPLASGDRFKPPRVHGDREFNGTPTQQPIWEVDAKVSRSSNKLFGRVSMHAWEDDGDASEGDGATGWIEIATVPAGKIISQIAGSDKAWTSGDLSVFRNGRDTNRYPVQTIADPGAFVLNWKVWGDTNGDDLDFFTGVRADLERIYVRYP
jgi:hypothetical protein